MAATGARVDQSVDPPFTEHDIQFVAEQRSPAAHPTRPTVLAVLAAALRVEYERNGTAQSLYEAIERQRELIDGLPPGHAEGALHRTEIANSLLKRFDLHGEIADLDAVIAYTGQALDGTHAHVLPLTFTVRTQALYKRSMIRRAYGEHDAALRDAEEAVSAAENAVAEGAGATGHMYPTALFVLGRAYLNAAHMAGAIDRAVNAFRASVKAVDAENPMRQIARTALAAAITARDIAAASPRRRNRVLAAQALVLRAVMRRSPRHSPEWKTAGLTLVMLLRARDNSVSPATVEEAVHLAGALDTSPVVTLDERLTALAAAAAIAMTAADPRSADLFARAVELQPLVAWQGTSYASRTHLLISISENTDWSRSGSLASDAAASTLAAGRPSAVELLEHGRGVLWAQHMQTRTDDVRLRQADPDLADRLRRIGTALRALGDA